MGFGEKKCIMALYTVANYYLDNFTIFKENDTWKAYLTLNDNTYVFSSPLIFDVCSNIIKTFNNDELTARFINILKCNISEEEINDFIEQLNEPKLKRH